MFSSKCENFQPALNFFKGRAAHCSYPIRREMNFLKIANARFSHKLIFLNFKFTQMFREI